VDRNLPREGGYILGKGNIVASLDLGSSKVCCMIGEITRAQEIDILGYGIAASSGIKKGMITNIDQVVQSIGQAIQQAEQMSSTKITSAVVGISGANITLLNNRGVVAIPRNEKEITPQDVDRVLQASKIMAIPYDREIIDIIPREFSVDGCDDIKDPVGMVGTRLEVSACIVTGLVTAVQNIVRCVQKAGLDIEGLVIKPLASAQVLLTEDEINMGVLLLDVGAGSTEVAVFQEGSIQSYDLIPIGGDFITNDIAIGLRIPFVQAEDIKRRYACCHKGVASDKSDIEIQSIGETAVKKISQKELAAIVEPRVQEILSYIYESMKNLNIRSILPAGAVLTGGGLIHIKGSLEMAQQILGMPVRPGFHGAFNNDQTFTVGLGLLYYSINKHIEMKNQSRERLSFF
jgi:cell division protein FtsA